MLLCLSATRIYNTLSILIHSRKIKISYCSISFLVHPGRSPGMMLLFLSASRIYNTLTILIRSRKKKKAVVLYPFWFSQVEVLVRCYYSWALLGYITRLAFWSVAGKKKLSSCSISFLVHPGRSPCVMLLCLSACRICNMFSISIRSRKKKKKKRHLVYILSGSPRLKSWYDVIIRDRF